jgi:uncharacterized protein YbaP (TraB family)
MKKLLIAFAFLFTSVTVFAKGEVNTLLYKVSGNGLKKASYIYGTIHMICEDDFFMMDGLITAMQKVDALYLEIDITDSVAMGLAMSKFLDPSMKEFYAEIDENTRNLIEQMVLQMELTFEIVSMFKPIMISLLLTQSLYDCAIKSYEVELAAMAKEAGIALKALETAEEQVAIFDAIPIEEQFQSLVELVSEFEDAREGLKQMVGYYKEMNLQGLMKAIEDDAFMEHDEEFLTKRNQNWIPIIEKQMRTKPALFAVGAAHLLGENGVIKLLQEKGFKVDPVL